MFVSEDVTLKIDIIKIASLEYSNEMHMFFLFLFKSMKTFRKAKNTYLSQCCHLWQ